MKKINTLQIKFEELGRLFIETKSDKVFSEMYKSSYPVIKIIVKKYIQNNSIMEEVINDCYVKLGNNIHKYENGNNLLGWFMKISKRVALDYVLNRTNGGISDIFNSLDRIESLVVEEGHNNNQDNIDLILSREGIYESSEYLEVDEEQEYENRVNTLFLFFETLDAREQCLIYEKYILGKKYEEIRKSELFASKKTVSLRTDVSKIKDRAKVFLKTIA
jgi:RNA polymerase sigma factor (sigma-70 family)